MHCLHLSLSVDDAFPGACPRALIRVATRIRFRAFAEEEEEEEGAAPVKKAPAKPAEKYKISGDYKAGKTCGGGSSGG